MADFPDYTPTVPGERAERIRQWHESAYQAVFSFSDTHGPALVDLLGVVIVVLAWLPVAALLWSHRGRLRGGAARLVALLVLVSAVLLVAAIGSDVGSVWLVPAALLVVAQVLAVAIIARRA